MMALAQSLRSWRTGTQNQVGALPSAVARRSRASTGAPHPFLRMEGCFNDSDDGLMRQENGGVLFVNAT